MDPKLAPGGGGGQAYSHVGLGCQFAGGVIMFVAGGWGLDRWLGLTPLFTIVGTLAGAVLSFLTVYRKIQADTEARRRERDTRGP